MALVAIPFNYNGAAPIAAITYRAAILKDSPIAYWPLNETSGTVAYDISGNNNNAAYQATPLLGETPIAPALGSSILLNGSTQYVELAAPPSELQITAGSFEAWVNLTATPDGGGLFANAYNGAVGGTVNFALAFGSTLGAASGSQPFTGAYTGSAWVGALDASALTTGTAYHIVGTYNGTTFSLYINGVLIITGTGTAGAVNANPIYMGRRWDGAGTDSFLAAYISNFAMYNTVLTAAQIQNHYNVGIG